MLALPGHTSRTAGGSNTPCPSDLFGIFPKEKDAWREVDRLGLLLRVNDEPGDVRIRFDALAEHYLKADFGEDAVRPKSENTIPIVEHYVRDYLIARWGKEIAEDIKPFEIQRWLKSLHDDAVSPGRRSRRSGASCSGSTRSASFTNMFPPTRSSTSRHAQNQLPGHRPHPGSDACHSQIPHQPTAFRAGADLCGDGSAFVGDSVASLG